MAGNIADKFLERFFSYISGRSDFEDFFQYVSGEKDQSRLNEYLHSLGQPSSAVRARFQDLLSGKGRARSPTEEWVIRFFREGDKPKHEVDEYVVEAFRKAVSGGRPAPVERAINLKYFPEFDIVNRYYIKRREEQGADEDKEDTTDLLIASNRESLGLYKVTDRGFVEESDSEGIEYICLGSGEKFIEPYFEDMEYTEDSYIKKKIGGGVKLDNVSLYTAYWLAAGAMEKAIAKDKNSGGFIEFVFVTADSVRSKLGFVQERLTEEKYKCYDLIAEELKPKEEPSPEPKGAKPGLAVLEGK